MNKITKIIKREYLTRVQKKSFILMSILGPILFAALMIVPVWIAGIEDGEERKIAVIDSSSIFDYTKILKEVTLLNTQQLRNDVLSLNPKASAQDELFKELANRLLAISDQRDNKISEHIQLTIKETIDKLQQNKTISKLQADSIYHRHSSYYDLLIKEFEGVRGRIPNDERNKFEYIDMPLEVAKEVIKDDTYYAVIFIPQNILSSQQIQILSKSVVSMSLRSYIQSNIERAVESHKMIEVGVSFQTMNQIKTKINTQMIQINEEGVSKENTPELAMIIGYFSGILIYFVIFMFGSMVMRGVIEEKTNRVIEVILSSVKPFQLMLGKIIGVGCVGLTQFLLWIVLTFSIIQVATVVLSPTSKDIIVQQQTQEILGSGTMQNIIPESDEDKPKISILFSSLSSINFPLIIGMFLFYFLGGYLLYGALFAAVGAAVDNESDNQQFMAPITIPLILGIVVMANVTQNPDSNISYWFSIIPFTSPIVMMGRLPYGVPTIDIVISMTLLVATFIFTTWLAAKIYKTGILMYGAKVGWKDLWKWIRHL